MFENSLKLAISYLIENQNPDGSFFSYSSINQDHFREAKRYKTIFANGLILQCMSGLKFPGVDDIKNKLVKFLLNERRDTWLYNYWASGSKESKKYMVPDDLDDTFVVLAALILSDIHCFRPKDYASITHILTTMEVTEGGPYRTWQVGSDCDQKWLDVDLAVNANVAYFLFLNQIELPNHLNYFKSSIADWDLQSKYYPNIFSTIYYLSRFYRGLNYQKLSDWLWDNKQNDGSWGNAVNTALAVNSLLNMDFHENKLTESINWLVHSQKNGSWPAGAFCLDPMIGGEKYYSGSEYLTTAMCVSAISKYYHKISNTTGNQKFGKEGVSIKYESIRQTVVSDVRHYFKKLGGNLGNDSRIFLDEIIAKDSDGEIVLLPAIVAGTLRKKIGEDEVKKFCQAGLYGWMAYTLYDNFLDGDSEAWMLPVANVCSHKLSKIYYGFNNSRISRYYEKSLLIMERSNCWEVNNTRFIAGNRVVLKKLPDYGSLKRIADKSFGHALGGVGVFLMAGADDHDLAGFISFFQHYLMARQLNDDAHDWEDDLKKGQINAAGSLVLADMLFEEKKDYFIYNEDIDDLRVTFWKNTINKISEIIFKSTAQARTAIGDVKIVKEKSFYLKRLDKLDDAASKAIMEANEVGEFINSFV